MSVVLFEAIKNADQGKQKTIAQRSSYLAKYTF
jgi:hypothetical protein